MASLNKPNYVKLLHDVARISKGLGILKKKDDPETKDLLISLLEDELKRVYSDVKEIQEISELNKYDSNKLLNDIDRISQGLAIFKEANPIKTYQLILDLLENEVTRIHTDLEEMKEVNGYAK